MKTIYLLSLSLVFLLSAGCGKGEQNSSHSSKKQDQKKGENLECAAASSLGIIPQTLAPDYDVKFHRKTLESVLEDIHGKKVSATNFWSSLTPSVRNLLNYELNLFLIEHRASNPLAVYQSTAYFFAGVSRYYDETADYKVRDAQGIVYAFKIRGVNTKKLMLFNYKCGRHERTDLSGIKVNDVIQVDQVQEVYQCRSVTKSLTLMEMKEGLYLKAGESIYKLPATQLNKKEKKRRLDLNLETNQISLEIRIKKKREEVVGDWAGRRSDIVLIAPDYAMDEEGGCNTLIRALTE